MAHDVLDVFAHMILICSQPYTTCTVKELPVFIPNEWFFQKYQKSGEERWETYMRIIREIMAENLGFKQSEAKLEDKFDYKAALYPSKAGKKD